MTFEKQQSVYLSRCERALEKAIGSFFTKGTKVAESASYSLLNGGKRVRGVLVLAVCELLGGDFLAADAFAAAIEMVHAFSLIHDDLPCMDDDDMRRGKPSNHIVFGEATSLLAGDALAIAAFETICSAPIPAEMTVRAAKTLAAAAGDRGMIFGQEIDLKYETETADASALLQIHSAKTGALILASAELGMISALQSPKSCAAITQYSKNIGLTFQIIDDILDVTSSSEVLGKPVGSDAEKGKTTFVTLYGVDASRREAGALTESAVSGLSEIYGSKADFLCQFARKLMERLS